MKAGQERESKGGADHPRCLTANRTVSLLSAKRRPARILTSERCLLIAGFSPDVFCLERYHSRCRKSRPLVPSRG